MEWTSIFVEASKIVLTVILTAIASYIVYKKFTKRKVLAVYPSRSIPIVQFRKFEQKNLAEKIRILYNEEPLFEDLYAARVTIENVGNDVISVDDIDNRELVFRIVSDDNPNVRILDIEVLEYPRTSRIQVNIKNNREIYVKNFNFLNPGEKIELRILFTGVKDIVLEPLFRIKGGDFLKILPQQGITKIHTILLGTMLALLVLILGFTGFIVIAGFSGDTEYIVNHFDVFFAILMAFVVITILLDFVEKILHLNRDRK